MEQVLSRGRCERLSNLLHRQTCDAEAMAMLSEKEKLMAVVERD